MHINITALDAQIVAGSVVCDQPLASIMLYINGEALSPITVAGTKTLENGFVLHSFVYRFAPGDLPPPVARVYVSVRLDNGQSITTKPVKIPVVAPCEATSRPDWVLRLPFAPVLAGQLYDMGIFKGYNTRPAFDDAVYIKAAKAVRALAKYGAPVVAAPARHFVLFLRTLAYEFSQIAAFWPKINPEQTDCSAKDSAAMLTTTEEMLVIAAYLYVLKHHRIEGRFCEFGCFTGFSTACLSIACARLGMTMDCFDSFAGLPPSPSSYYKAGDFACDQQTVARNVALFGRIDCVNFHPGFFDKTVADYAHTPLCLWLDVDLTKSAQAIVPLMQKLPKPAGMFTNECLPGHFNNAALTPKGGPDDPVTAIHGAFNRHDNTPAGFFVAGDTGFIAPDNRHTIACPTLQMLKILTGTTP